MKLKHFIGSVIIMALVCGVWVFLEQLIYGAPETRVVDDIMMLFLFPCFYATSAWLEEKTTKKQNAKKAIGPLGDVKYFDDMDAEDE